MPAVRDRLEAYAPFVLFVPLVANLNDHTPDNHVTFVVAGPVGPPALNSVTATIGSAAAGGKLFGRLVATE